MDTSQSNIDISNINSNIIQNITEKCCILTENCSLKNTIQLQSDEIGKIIQERNEFKNLYENLLSEVNREINRWQ